MGLCEVVGVGRSQQEMLAQGQRSRAEGFEGANRCPGCWGKGGGLGTLEKRRHTLASEPPGAASPVTLYSLPCDSEFALLTSLRVLVCPLSWWRLVPAAVGKQASPRCPAQHLALVSQLSICPLCPGTRTCTHCRWKAAVLAGRAG